MKKTVSLLLAFLILCTLSVPCAAAAAPEAVLRAAEEIVAYKKTAPDGTVGENLFAGDFLNAAGSTAGDWYPFGMAALGMADDYAAYLAALRENVRVRYQAEGALSPNKATEWHRVILAALSCGADPTRFCMGPDGAPVDLLADGVFFRENVGRQGLNGYIWALIALHACPCETPANAVNTEETLFAALEERQLANGGWAAAGEAADADLTAMALIALAPMAAKNGAAKAAADRAIECLASLQNAEGGYENGGFANCESCAVVVAALCENGVDPEKDPRFTKNGRTPVDALLSYRLPDGSFTHAFISDPENPSAVPMEPNDMSCQQALYALAAYYNLLTGKGRIFDFSGKPLSDAGWDVLPAPPSAAEQAADTLRQRLGDFFAEQTNRKTVIAAALALAVILGAVALAVRAKRRKGRKDA